MQKDVTKPAEKIDLSPINQDLDKLAALIASARLNDDKQLNQLLSENRTVLSHKLDVIHQVINDLDKKQHPVKFLSVSALPFKVISIDSIQQVSVVTIEYDFKTIPLEKGDALAGWAILNIDFGKQRLLLENSNKERVLVKLGDQHA